MNGIVDDNLRALIPLAVAGRSRAKRSSLQVWIDTAFNGGLAVPREQIASLQLTRESSAEAVLADGNVVELETYGCWLDWFGATYQTQIVANDGEFPLLGTMLLDGRRLVIDYPARAVALT